MVAAFNPLLEPDAYQQMTQIIKWYVGICSPSKYLEEEFIVLTHDCGSFKSPW